MGLIDNILSRLGSLFTAPDAPAAPTVDPHAIERAIIASIEERAQPAQQILLRATNAVLGGPRHGFTYTRHGITWQASAPGEPPAERTGGFRYGWITPPPKIERTPNGATVTITIQSRQPYARFFDPSMPGFVGSARMGGARPFVDAVMQQARNQIHQEVIGSPFLSVEKVSRV
jgi:hypothetical protein